MAGIGSEKEVKFEWWKTNKDIKGNNVEDLWKRISVFAEVRNINGSQNSLRNGLESVKEFKVRFKPNLYPNADFRLVYRGKSYKFLSLELDEENRFKWVIKAQCLQ